MSWKRSFDDPIVLPGGRQLVTLEDAGDYITKLPKAEQDLEEWQAAVRECTALVNAVEGRAQHDGPAVRYHLSGRGPGLSRAWHPGIPPRTIREILGSPDDLKFHSSMTLFGAMSSDPDFAAAIAKFCGGKPDQMTLDLLRG